MSINVTVSGNPVSINRGKMITASDPQIAKKEFDKRRLLRLEQVRQQSRELAEDVRNKVKREKKKQVGEIEREGKEKFKNWQNRKLMELQNQYLDALDEIGIGHKEAEKYADENEMLEAQQHENEIVAKNRGKVAETKMQIQKNEENYKKAKPIQHKKLVRDIENTRAALVSSMGKHDLRKPIKTCSKKTTKPNKPTTANINISIPNDSDFIETSSSSDSSKQLSNIQEESNNGSEQFCQHDSEGFCECSESSEELHGPELQVEAQVHQEQPKKSNVSSEFGNLESRHLKQNSYQNTIDEQRKLIEDFRSRSREMPLDTRISDRIKRRLLMASQPDYCDTIADPTPVDNVDEITKIRDKISGRSGSQYDAPVLKDALELSTEMCICTKLHGSCPCKLQEGKASKSNVDHFKKTCKCKPKKGHDTSKSLINKSSKEIPSKQGLKESNQHASKIQTLSSAQAMPSISSEAYKVCQYDHSAPYTGPSTVTGSHYDYSNGFIQDTKRPVDQLASKVNTVPSEAQRVQQFDHPNRFGREMQEIPTKPAVKLKDIHHPSSKSSAAERIRQNVHEVPEIPTKSPGKLKDFQHSHSKIDNVPSTSSNTHRVRQYDHPNRFIRDVPSTSHVEKISSDSIEVIPNAISEREWHEKMKQRDIEAQIRGKRAMEKEKVQRDYEEMMKKLPMLQRKQQISQIGTDKPEYHMSDDRLKERERERQNRLENAYIKAMPDLKPQIVTLPSRKHEIPTKADEPFEILDGDDSRILNLGKWDTDSKPKTMFSAEEVQEIIRAFTVQKPEDRKKKLKQLLKTLKLQKEQLINEIRNLPRDDSINALLSDLTLVSDSDEKVQRSSKHKRKEKDKSERKRRREESDSSSSSTSDTANEKKMGKRNISKNKDKKYGRSPHKKSKKPVEKVRVLQNTSTQTTPKPIKEKSSKSSTTTTTSSSNTQASDQQQGEKSENALTKICSKTHTPCDCQKNESGKSEEVCKIFIKLSEEDSPKIEVVKSYRDSTETEDSSKRRTDEETKKSPKSPRKEKERKSKSPKKLGQSRSIDKEITSHKERPKRTEITTDSEQFKKQYPKQIGKPAVEKGEKLTPARSKKESWKEHLSKNSVSTTSTSYLSPPDFSRINSTASTDPSKQSEFNLRKKPQQRNIMARSLKSSSRSIRGEEPEIDPRLFLYVKRLLSMSKISVDDLGVSSSDVPTPSQSIIEMESNNPMAAFHNVMRFINAQADEIAKELSISDDNVHAPPNSSVEESEKSGPKDHSKDITPQMPQKDDSGKIKELLLTQYADVTDCCTKRIANLAAMIEQLRQEKIQMLQSPPLTQTRHSAQQDLALLTPTFSDKDNSTKYFQFPPSGEKSKGTNSTASIDEEELNRRLLEIDMDLAEKLKKFRMVPKSSLEQTDLIQHSSEDSTNYSDPEILQPVHSIQQSQEHNLSQTDQEFLQRLQNLVQENKQKPQEEPKEEIPLPEVNIDVPFVPFLVDIPKLPILEPEPEGFDNGVSEKRHPPPSKGLIAAKKFNGNISLIPHELSTIIEADSQMSTRISPNNSKTAVTTSKDLIRPLSPTVEEHSLPTDNSQEKNSSKSSKNSPSCTNHTCPNIALSTSGSSSKLTSSGSTSNLKSMEDMLKSIGMEWAIPTLHKTKEALALSSSSSSGDLSSNKKSESRKSPSTSEVSLKEFLKNQLMSKISSSSMKSEASPASFVRECSELSAIQGNSSTERGKQQRTSTPVLSKSTSKSKDKDEQQQFFTGASDLSSVRNNSSSDGRLGKNKNSFKSLPGEEESSSLTKSSVG